MRLVGSLILIAVFSLSAFAQSAAVKGKVKDDNERSLSGVTVDLEQDGKKLKSVSTGGNGEFFMDGLSDGIYLVKFEKDGYSAGSFRFEIKKGKGGDLSKRSFLLPKDRGTMATLQGTVFDQNGFSLEGAKVEVSRMTAGNVWEKVKTIYTGEDGEFLLRFPQVDREINYRVTVTYGGSPPQTKEKSTDGAGIYRLAFNLPVKRSAPQQ